MMTTERLEELKHDFAAGEMNIIGAIPELIAEIERLTEEERQYVSDLEVLVGKDAKAASDLRIENDRLRSRLQAAGVVIDHLRYDKDKCWCNASFGEDHHAVCENASKWMDGN